jgi:hypothetical protein
MAGAIVRQPLPFSPMYSIANESSQICESAINNVACFLEAKPWQQLLRSLSITGRPFARKGHIGVGLLCIKARMPRLLRDVTCIVCEPSNVDSADLFALIARLQKFRTDLVSLYAELDGLALKASKSEHMILSYADERPELFGDALSLLIMGCRMLCAVSMDAIWVLEDEALTYSDQMVRLEKQATPANCSTGFVLSQKLSIAQATLNTSHVWRKSPSQINIVERSAFKAWCDAIPVDCSFD